MPEPKKVNFAAWSLDSLIQFATEANELIRQQQEAIEQLRADGREALNAYRRLIAKQEEEKK